MPGRITIAAVATPPGVGALAIIRVSGPEAHSIVSSIVQKPEKFSSAVARFVCLFTLINPTDKLPIDEVSIIKYFSPRSFTGEDMVEIICHGGKRVVEEIMIALYSSGAQPAARGAFTRRALENGKIDLMKAEAIKGIIESRSEAELLCAKKMYAGAATEIILWKEKIQGILSHLEADIEFGEEDHVAEYRETGKEQIEEILFAIKENIRRREAITKMEQGIKVIIAGPANAGKSTLFNKLIGYNRVLVHHEPGTTRDLVTERIQINGHEVLLMDCAGLRATNHEVEKEGITVSRMALGEASVVLWVTAADEPLTIKEIADIHSVGEKKWFYIINKNDRAEGKEKKQFFKQKKIPGVSLSLIMDTSLNQIVKHLEHSVDEIISSVELPNSLLNKRYEQIGKETEKHLRKAHEVWSQPEIAAQYLKEGLSELDEICGTTTPEDLLNRIFDTFCIGK